MPLARSIYDLLTNQEDARACRDIPDAACRVSPGSFPILLGSCFLSKLGDVIADPRTVPARVMSSAGAPAWMPGLLVVFRPAPVGVLRDGLPARMPVRS